MIFFTHFDFETYSLVAWGEKRDTMHVYWPVLRNHGNRLQYDQRITLHDFHLKHPATIFPAPVQKTKADIIKKYGEVVYDRAFDRV